MALPLVALALAVSARPLGATSIALQSIDEMTERADVIVRALPKPGRSATMWDASHRYIVTHTTLTVLESFHGNVQVGAEITVSTLGGFMQADDIRMHVPAAPVFLPNEEVVLFLEGQGDVLRTVDLSAGKFEVHADQGGIRVVTRHDLSEANIVAGNLNVAATLEELRAKITAATHRKQAQRNIAGAGPKVGNVQQPAVPPAATEAKRQERTANLAAKGEENQR